VLLPCHGAGIEREKILSDQVDLDLRMQVRGWQWDFHADLAVQLQQGLLQVMCRLCIQ
jgi:hypothetical protein